MARYDPKKDLKEPLNDSFEGGDESKDATEEDIESNFVSYRPYVESCVSVIDLIVYLKLFTQGMHAIKQQPLFLIETRLT